MRRTGRDRRAAPALLAAVLAALAGRTAVAQEPMARMSAPVTIPKGALFTAADVHFMQGMIAHHAQAIYMSHLAATHDANPRLLKLATKIEQSQVAEIHLMQDWLRRNGQSVPDTSSWRAMRMPGMLTARQLVALGSATGADFDRDFLALMIQHHEGALAMVSTLLATPGAAQDVNVNVFANDVQTVQTAEIGIMRAMLDQVSHDRDHYRSPR